MMTRELVCVEVVFYLIEGNSLDREVLKSCKMLLT